MRARNTIAAVIMLLLPVMLQGCGRKGPLYLQQKPAAPLQATPAQAAPNQAPLQTEPLQAGPQTQPAQNAVIQTPIDTKKQP